MSYQVRITTSAAKSLMKLPRIEQKRIRSIIDQLATDPRPYGVTKLSGGLDSYRVRVGNYRIVYTIDDGLLDEIEDLRDHLAVYESRNEPTMSFDKLVAELGLND